MKTLVDVDDKILREAMRLSESSTKKETINLALEELIKSRFRMNLRRLAGSGVLNTRLSDLKKTRNRRVGAHRKIRRGTQ